MGLDQEDYAWYRDLRRYGTVPGPGHGIETIAGGFAQALPCRVSRTFLPAAPLHAPAQVPAQGYQPHADEDCS